MTSDSPRNEALLPADFVPNSFEKAIEVTASGDPNTYTADLRRDWVIGLGKCQFIVFHHF